ncbi:MAG TPA: hypothetical protein DCK76_03685 [Desulfotomaculum sp.]|nr:MAG: hypothetical protein XD84_0680 [Desulfotomaculum sp. 46_80]HAG10489.1 hypothetical protein [Desulfotomaculum sp.]HBY04088.1 hypothetical protein [Desulfotomaculum sp.]
MYEIRKVLGFILITAFIFVCFGLAGCSGNKKEASNSSQVSEGEGAGQKETGSTLADLITRGQELEEGLSYDYTMTSGDIKMSGRMCMMKNKFRSETRENDVEVISITDGNTFYTYYPAQNMAVRFPDFNNNEQAATPEDYLKNIDTAKTKELGTEVCNGVTCKVITMTTPGPKITTTSGPMTIETKMWIHGEYGIPVRIEMTNADGTKTVLDYTNIKIGKQPDELFTLPEGVKITDMSNLAESLPQMPGQ